MPVTFALAMLLLASGAAVPQTPTARYTVEIIVFRNTGELGALPGPRPTEPVADDGVEMTVSTSRKLNRAASGLRSGGMKVLAHTGWTQAPASCGGSACRNALRGVSAAQLGLTRAGISGKVGLQRGTNLFLGIDLTIDDGGRRYRITEARQIRKVDEVQYFDHPAVGVIAVVSAAPALP